jgi:O-antigen ligase
VIALIALSVPALAALRLGVLADVPIIGRSLNTQWQAFQERVIGGLTARRQAQDLGIIWRGTEQGFAAMAFREEPWTGVGLGRPYRPQVLYEPFGDPTYYRRFVHNLYYSYAARGGIIGLAGLLALIFIPIITAWKRVRGNGLLDLPAVIPAVVFPAFAIMSTVDPVFVNETTGVVTGGLLALLGMDSARFDNRVSNLEEPRV